MRLFGTVTTIAVTILGLEYARRYESAGPAIIMAAIAAGALVQDRNTLALIAAVLSVTAAVIATRR